MSNPSLTVEVCLPLRLVATAFGSPGAPCGGGRAPAAGTRPRGGGGAGRVGRLRPAPRLARAGRGERRLLPLPGCAREGLRLACRRAPAPPPRPRDGAPGR